MSEMHPLAVGLVVGAISLAGYITGAIRQRMCDRKDIAYVLGMDEDATWGEVQEQAQRLRRRDGDR